MEGVGWAGAGCMLALGRLGFHVSERGAGQPGLLWRGGCSLGVGWAGAGRVLALGRLGFHVSEKGAGQPGPLRGGGGCSLGFGPCPLKGIGRLHYFQIFL
jgi:hypothetical protein